MMKPRRTRLRIESVEEGDVCPFCNDGTIQFTGGYEPYSPDHLSCPTCDSTYVLPKKTSDPGRVAYLAVAFVVTLLICMAGLWLIATILEAKG